MHRLSDLPIVVVPGIQGHWEWMRPALDALRATASGKVLTFSLNEEDGTGDPFAQWDARITDLISTSGSDKVVLMGVSFGGLVASRYAARHADRTGALILVSAPSPTMTLGAAEQRSLRHPIASLPLFALRGARRLLPEVWSARPTWASRLSFLCTYGWQILRRPIAPARMVRWVAAWKATDIAQECAQITAPTHIITGEPHLDGVVPVTSTREYLTLIAGASASTLSRTGHIGLVSRPDAFAALVHEFLHAADASRSRRSA